jgi:glutamate racemase
VSSSGPIGLFDSGVGGLSILRHVRRALPHENLVYAADSRFAPYGDRTDEEISTRARVMVDFLVERGAKAVVIACNTATAATVDSLRAGYRLPIVGMEPAVKPAAALTRSGVVGVLATTRTIASARFQKLVAAHRGGARVLPQACPGFVEQVETGDLWSGATRSLVERHVKPLVEAGADTLVLGCTHYSFLADVIHAVAGEAVTLVDSVDGVTRELDRRLGAEGLRTDAAASGAEEFWSTSSPAEAGSIFGQLWGSSVDIRCIPRSHL